MHQPPYQKASLCWVSCLAVISLVSLDICSAQSCPSQFASFIADNGGTLLAADASGLSYLNLAQFGIQNVAYSYALSRFYSSSVIKGIHYDYYRQIIYLTTSTMQIRQLSLGLRLVNNLTDLQVIVLSDQLLFNRSGNLTNIAVDWINNELYWVESTPQGACQIMHADAARLVSCSFTTLTSLCKISLSVDPCHGYLYWSDSNGVLKVPLATARNASCSLPTSSSYVVPNLPQPVFTVDLKANLLYYVDQNAHVYAVPINSCTPSPTCVGNVRYAQVTLATLGSNVMVYDGTYITVARNLQSLSLPPPVIIQTMHSDLQPILRLSECSAMSWSPLQYPTTSLYSSATASNTSAELVIRIVEITVPILASIVILFLLLLLLLTVYLIKKKRRKDVSKENTTGQNMVIQIRKLDEDELCYYKDMFKDSLIMYTQLHFDIIPIGAGAFGKVYKGVLKRAGCTLEDVAIKTVKNITSDDDIRSFFAESATMTTFQHPNILGLLGVCFDSPDGTPLMVLPFMVNGNLKTYLIKSRNPLSVQSDIFPNGLGLAVMTRMCGDIARGMCYLADKRFVHRDLAARNCLLDHNLNVRIGDFGLARDVYMTNYYKASAHTALPVKWMPPEMLRDGISNEMTDIWAYGVTCWEIFSLGATPYPGVDNHLMLEHLMKGLRLSKPALCTEEIYLVLKQCWCDNPDSRPHFSSILSGMNVFLETPYYV